MADSNSVDLPFDVIREILLKLPANSLLRFTLVSKSWRTCIISSPFISDHLAQTPHSNTLLVRRYVSAEDREHYLLFQDSKNRPSSLNFLSELHFPFHSQGMYYYRMVGSCNGILCLSDDMGCPLRNIILWNPSIHKFINLPLPLINPQWPFTCVLGFGADLPNTNDYKLVRLVFSINGVYANDGPPEMEIYSINSGVWRRVMEVEIPHFIVGVFQSQAFVNGVVHWIAYGLVENDGHLRSLVMTFRIANEMFGKIRLPDGLVGVIPSNLSIMLFEESLAVVKYERKHHPSCEVWVMQQYGVFESWSRLYRINLVSGMEKVVGFRNNGEVLFSTWSNDLVSYDPNSGRNTDVGIPGFSPAFYVHNYRESLILLNGNRIIPHRILERIRRYWLHSLRIQ